ncbi:MAG: hypothetical protein NTV54_13120 [Ignavibacteriales bacterium]|nr:hypothetical protein [Ignavibacteriales bacterium]
MKNHSVLGPILVALAFMFVMTQVAEAAGTPAGTTITTRASATFTTLSGAAYSTVYSEDVTVTVVQVAALNVASSPQNQTVHDGTSAYYPLTITNSGNGSDVFTLSASSTRGFTAKYYFDSNGNGSYDSGEPEITSGKTASVAADASYKIIVAVAVPKDQTLHNQTDVTTFAATSDWNNAKTASANLQTTIQTTYFSNIGTALSVTPSRPSPGGTVTYTFTVTNTGTVTATPVTFSFPVSSPLSSVTSASPSGSLAGGVYTWNISPIAAGASQEVSITLTVDGGAPYATPISRAMTVDYTSDGLSYSVTSNSPTCQVVGAPSKYLVTSSSSTPVGGSSVTITAQLVDASNNTVALGGRVVTWSKTGTDGSFATATSTTNASGVATVVFTPNATTGSTHTVTGTDGGGLTGSTGTITTQTGGAAKYLVTSSSSNPAVGTGVTITAQLVDAGDNPVAEANRVVTWSSAGAGGSFPPGTGTTNASGIVTVTFTTHTVAGTVHTVTATDAGSLTGTTSNITTVAGTATHYVVASTDYGPIAGANVTISAQLADQYENPVGISGRTVTWGSTGTGGSFANATSTTFPSGLATIVFTTHTVAGTVHTVTANDGTVNGTSPNREYHDNRWFGSPLHSFVEQRQCGCRRYGDDHGRA